MNMAALLRLIVACSALWHCAATQAADWRPETLLTELGDAKKAP